MYVHPKEIEALYASLHRLAQAHVPGCTLEQVRKTANYFCDRDTTRLQYAFRIYWELAESRIEDTYTDRFLELLREKVEADARKQSRKKASKEEIASVRDYWKK